MTRVYPELVGLKQYCEAVQSDPRCSPFVPVEVLSKPERLMAASPQDIADLAEDGFFIIDSTGRLVEDGSATRGSFVIAPHVCQREVGGPSPACFDRQVGQACGFGGRRAARLPKAKAATAVTAAWNAWSHR